MGKYLNENAQNAAVNFEVKFFAEYAKLMCSFYFRARVFGRLGKFLHI